MVKCHIHRCISFSFVLLVITVDTALSRRQQGQSDQRGDDIRRGKGDGEAHLKMRTASPKNVRAALDQCKPTIRME